MKIEVPPVNENKFSLEVIDNTILIKGELDSQFPSLYLKPFFDKIHEDIVKKRIKEVTFDITKLNFLNSSALKDIVDWFLKLDLIEDKDKYKIKIKINKDYLWQESCVSTLTFLNPDYIIKEN